MCGQEKSGADPQGDALFAALLENLSVPVYPLPSLPQGLSAFDGADEGLYPRLFCLFPFLSAVIQRTERAVRRQAAFCVAVPGVWDQPSPGVVIR